MPYFNSLGWFSFSSFIISGCKLLIAVESWWQLIWKKLTGIFMYRQKSILVLNFSSLGWYFFHQLLSAVINCWQLMRADMTKNLLEYIYVHTKVDNCAKVQLSRLIFVFTNCYQLSSAADSCWQVMPADMKKFDWIFYEHTKVSALQVDFHFN